MSRNLAPRQCSIRVLSCDHMELMDGSEKRKGICLPFKRHSAVPGSRPWDEVRGGGEVGGGGAVGGGEQSSRPLEKGEGRSPKSFFRSFRPQYGLKIRGRAPCPSHGSATAVETHQRPLNSKTRTHKCEIFSVLTSARLWTSVILAGKNASRRHFTTSFSQNVVV